MIAISVLVAFNASFLSAASSLTPAPTTQNRPAVTQQPPPKLPVQSPADATKGCYTDPNGKMICPNSGTTSTPADPLGAACKTAAGVNGIWVVTSSASSMTCAATGGTCYTPTGGMGKVWGTGTAMRCGGKGDYCPLPTGSGKVFDMGRSLACLGYGASCSRTLAGAPCNGCKVLGTSGNYMTYDCAKKYVVCPASAQAYVRLTPSTGQFGSAVPVVMLSTSHVDASAVYCDYILKDVGTPISYTIPCNGAYTNNVDGRYRACTAPGTNNVTNQVHCDAPGKAAGSFNSSMTNEWGADMSVLSSVVTANWAGSASDQAQKNAICNYKIDGFNYKSRIPCNSIKKAASGKNEFYYY